MLSRGRPDRLHGQQSLLRDHLVPDRRRGGAGREHVQAPARVRARDHLPVQPGLRLQRVLQVLQERRERALQVHSGGQPDLLRRRHQPRHRHRQHHRRGLRGDAVSSSTASGCASNFPSVAESMDRFIDKIKAGNAGRARSATWRSSASRSISTAPATRPAASGGEAGPSDHPFATRRRCSWPATRRWARPTSSRSRWASSARCSLAGLIAQRRPAAGDMLDRYEQLIYKQWLRVYMRSKMIKHNKDLFECPRRPVRAAGEAAHLLAAGPDPAPGGRVMPAGR